MMSEELKTNARQSFQDALSVMPGKKTLLVDPSFEAFLEVLSRGGGGKAFYDSLDITQILYVGAASNLPLASCESQLVFLLRPVPVYVKMMQDIVSKCRRNTFLAAWLPQSNGVCTLEMERQGLKGLVREVDMPIFLLPCEDFVWSLCWEAAFHNLYLNHERSILTFVVQSLLHLESQGLALQRVSGFGEIGEQTKNLFDTVQAAAMKSRPSSSRPTVVIDHCILLDRLNDPISLLVTPLHYEGLLDAVMDMQHGTIVHDGKKRVLQDEFYTSIRDMDFDQLTTLLSEMSTSLHVELSDTKASSSSNSISSNAAVADILRKLSSLAKTKQDLSLHVDLGQAITKASQEDMDALRRCVETEHLIMAAGGSNSDAATIDTMLEEALFRVPPLELTKTLKLLCLPCLVVGGFKQSALDRWKTQLCHTYGYTTMIPLLDTLTSLQWLFVKGSHSTWNWSTSKKRLDALVNGNAIANDIAFMFSVTGYAPLSVRTVQVAVGQRRLSGVNLPTASSASSLSTVSSASSSSSSSSKTKQTILVYYIGGVTVAEIAAFRFLNRVQDNYNFIIATTAICNPTRLLQSLGRQDKI
ncbi:unnamed protein product [Aphanomyces euteiches]|nr:hypothetical protein Ae201684P_021254 [Aphanomyces euteiches]